MPDPFDSDRPPQTRIVAPAGDAGAQQTREQIQAEALDVIRHAKAFVLYGTDGSGRILAISIGDAVGHLEMAGFFATVAEYADQAALQAVERAMTDDGVMIALRGVAPASVLQAIHDLLNEEE